MITLKLQDVINATPAIYRVLGTKFPFKAAYHLKKIGKRLESELNDYNDARTALVMEYGEAEVKDGQSTGIWTVKPVYMQTFVEQHKELTDIEIKIDLDPLKLEALGDTAEVAPSDLMACDKFIVE